MKNTINDIKERKQKGQKITMLTAYDYPMGLCLDRAGVDIILVGDSLANVVLGLESTREVGMDEMIHHCKAVRRGVKNALVVGDMPYEAYQADSSNALSNAKRFMDECGCDAVKLEWFDQCLEVTQSIVAEGIPVMGHVGLTPQRTEELGGYKVQGTDAKSAQEIIDQAKALEAKGCFSVVLECVPASVAQKITESINIPTIGIGAGIKCDGQVLVTHDLLGLFDRFHPKFVKQYVNLSDEIIKGVKAYCEDVVAGRFPEEKHSYLMKKDKRQEIG